jgi:hypothetical protein
MTMASAASIDPLVGEVGFPLRLPPELKAKLAAWAKRERRSLNAHIVFLLEGDVERADEASHPDERRGDSHGGR